nr:protein kinase [uncultured Oscillibacter sp.]
MNRQDHCCYNCFQTVEDSAAPCPRCGFDPAENRTRFPVALPAGTVLNSRYIVGRVLGQGGFGITYLAFDTQLQAKVAVKEYMPGEMATRTGTAVSVMMDTKAEDFIYGAERFREEARTLAKFIGHPNIAGVSSYFDENGTSYFVMDYIEGVSFKNYIANNGGKVSVDETLNVMIPVLRALTAVHAEGFIHRDVTPDNIYISKDGNVKLLDFGSARYSIGDKSKSLDVILKVGYAPKEQYTRRGRQGPYTDVYSCAACFYAALTGYLPPESLERLDHDELVPVSQMLPDIPAWLDRAVLKGLSVQPEDRFQSAAEFLDAIENQLMVEVPAAGTEAAETRGRPGRQDLKPILLGAAAAVLALAVGLGVLGSRGRDVPVSGDAWEEENLPAQEPVREEAPPVVIGGQSYSAGTTSLTLTGLSEGDLPALAAMEDLQSLELQGGTFVDLSPLAELPALRKLTVSGDGSYDGYDFQSLSGLTNLTELNIQATSLDSLQGLETLVNLERLTISGDVFTSDLTPLSGLTRLQTLVMFSSDGALALEDFSALSGLTELRQLRLNVHGLSSLAGLEGMTRMEKLQLQGSECVYTDTSPLAGMTGVTELTLPERDPFFEKGYDMSGLAGMTKLTGLRLPQSPTSLEPLRGLTGLKSLSVSSEERIKDAFTDLSPLSDLTGLTDLNLSLCYRALDIGPLSALTNLEKLYLNTTIDNAASNVLRDLTPLGNLVNLTDLTIMEWGVRDISPLRNLTKLQNLTIGECGGYLGNKITDWSPVDHVPNVTKY